MVDPNTEDATTSVPRCPWCSTELPVVDARTCPSCHANLAGEAEAPVPGLTALDLERLAFRRSTTPKKSRLLSWISGDSDYEDATDPLPPPGSLDLPPFEVRREMLRLEMDALIADLTAEAGALASDEADANGTDPVAAAAALQAEIDAVRRAEEVHAEAGFAEDVSVVDPDAPPAGPETLTAVLAVDDPSAHDDVLAATGLTDVDVAAPAETDVAATDGASPATTADAAVVATDGDPDAGPSPEHAAPAPRSRRFRRSR